MQLRVTTMLTLPKMMVHVCKTTNAAFVEAMALLVVHATAKEMYLSLAMTALANVSTIVTMMAYATILKF